jgi:hypothetical protein
MIDESSGKCSAAAGDCGSAASIPYFISFQVLGSFICLNLCVAVILENFGTLHNVNPELVSTSDIEVWTEAWARYDPDAVGTIQTNVLPSLLLHVPPPLGVQGTGRSYRDAMRLCMSLVLKHVSWGSKRVAFTEVLKELIDLRCLSVALACLAISNAPMPRQRTRPQA